MDAWRTMNDGPKVLPVALWVCALAACSAPSRTTQSAESPQHVAPTVAAAAKTAPQAPADDPASAATAKRVAHGAELYGRICAVCHGPSGEGYKADQAPAIGRNEFLTSVSDRFLRVAIRDGRTGSTMSAWSKQRGGPLAPHEIEAVIEFMRTWQQGPAVSLDESPVRGDADAGAKLFEAECKRCHGEDGMNVQAVRIGNPELLATATDGMLRHAIHNGRPGTLMEPFGDKLGAEGIENVIAFLRRHQAQTKPPLPPPPHPPTPLPLGEVPLNPRGPEPKGLLVHPETTSADVIHKQLVRGARMALLDARAPSDYTREHIAGAVSVPYYDPSPYLDKLPKDAWLVSYCACPHAESGELAGKLMAAGFTKVTVLAEGLGYWKTKGYKTEASAEQGKP